MAEVKQYPPLLSGHELVPLQGEEAARMYANFKGHTKGMGRIEPGGTMVNLPIMVVIDRIMNFKFTPTDVVIMTYPKCGTTWMQEIMWTIRNNPDLNNPMGLAPITSRIPFMELDGLMPLDILPPPDSDDPLMKSFREACPNGDPTKGVFIQLAESIAHPRTLKTHLPFSLMPKDMLDTSKVVYVMRDPKDVVVSYMHHCRIFKDHNFVGSNEDFVQDFINGDLLYGHYDRHIREMVERQGHPNLLVLRYEDIKADPIKQLKRIDQFIGTKRTEEQLNNVKHFTSFAEMKKRDNVLDSKPADQKPKDNPFFNMEIVNKDGGFFRKGVAGDWKKNLSPELVAKVNKWIAEKMADFPAEFRYDN